jgi:hypothetical protein
MVLVDIEGGRVDNFLLEVSMGHIKETSQEWIFANNPTVTTVMSDVWEMSGNYNFLTTAQPLYIWSTSTDTLDIKLVGLDSNYNIIEESITLSGTTPKTTINSYLRINKAFNNNGSDLLGNVYISRVSNSTIASNVVSYISNITQTS